MSIVLPSDGTGPIMAMKEKLRSAQALCGQSQQG
jgi:hypothetical protein